MVTFEIQKGYFTVWDGKTAYDLHLDEKRDYNMLPEPDEVYNLCIEAGMDEEQVIDTMLSIFHFKRLFKNGYLRELSLVFGFIGPRGSGKSVGAAALSILDFLLDGKSVWSNMPIEVNVIYRDCSKVFRSQPLDKAVLMDLNDFETQYSDGLVMIDELNIEIGDSRRSMSNQMLWFDFMLQEVRKRRMNVCYQLQAEDWSGSRTRWQTDFYISCRDYSILKGKPKRNDIGRFSRWRIHDMSGVVTGEVKYSDRYKHIVDHFNEIKFWNTPFWNTYNTGQFQKYEKFDPSKVNRDNGNEQDRIYSIDGESFARLTAGYSVLPELVLNIINLGQTKISRNQIWEILHVDDHSEKTRIGQLLKSLGCESTRGSDGERGYILPDKETVLQKITELGININETD